MVGFIIAGHRLIVFEWLEVLLLAMMVLLCLCICEYAITIGCWNVNVVVNSDLGGAAWHYVCSHALFDAALSILAAASIAGYVRNLEKSRSLPAFKFLARSLRYSQTSKAYIVLNVTIDESLPEPKSSPSVEDDRINEPIVQDLNGSPSLQVNVPDEGYPKILKEARGHPIEQVIGELNERTLRSKTKQA
ncbi:hypothetical protein Tco_0529118 [Tanacetum coccineum]